jgi:SAM-dependent methyltransferase
MTLRNQKYSPDILSNWDRQVNLFAKYFLAHVNLPETPFSLLDFGCGTGSALRVIKNKCPKATLYGCDVDELHLQISREKNGDCATFFKSDFCSISDHYDIIYVSNVIEHIRDWKAVVVRLVSRSNQLYILVPYKEQIKPPSSDLAEIDQHVSKFDKQSFRFLFSKGLEIKQRVIRTPYAWGHPLLREYALRFKAFISKNKFDVQHELLVSITKREYVVNRPFKNRVNALIEQLKV